MKSRVFLNSLYNSLILIKALAKLVNIAWQTLLFVSESLSMDKMIIPDLRRKQ